MNTSKFVRLLRDFDRATQGSVLIYVAFGITALIGMAALTVDVGLWYSSRRSLQSAADAGALAAVYALSDGEDASTQLSEAVADVAKNGYTLADGATVDRYNPPRAGFYFSNNDAVEIEVTFPASAMLSSVLGHSGGLVRAQAVAISEEYNTCVYSLNDSASGAIAASGGAQVAMDCGILSNSNADAPNEAIQTNGGAVMDVTEVITVGESDGSFGSATITENAQASLDPFRHVNPPASAPYSCTVSSGPPIRIQSTDPFPTSYPNGSVYCADIRVNAGGDLTFEPGVHIFHAGSQLTVNAGGIVTANGVTFYFTEDFDGNWNVNGGGALVMTAPIDTSNGGIPGVLIYEHRDNPGANYTINGGASLDLEGIIYLSNSDLTYSGGAVGSENETIIVADEVTFSGNTNITADIASSAVLSTFDFPENIRLVQ